MLEPPAPRPPLYLVSSSSPGGGCSSSVGSIDSEEIYGFQNRSNNASDASSISLSDPRRYMSNSSKPRATSEDLPLSHRLFVNSSPKQDLQFFRRNPFARPQPVEFSESPNSSLFQEQHTIPHKITRGNAVDLLSSPLSQPSRAAGHRHSHRIYNLQADFHSPKFPQGHLLNSEFVTLYQLEDEIGSGGYGFVMTACHRAEGHEVAVKFIIKDKVPEHAWMYDETVGNLPTEIVLLRFVNHRNIVKCLDVFEDPLYFYLVQELHGSPWPRSEGTSSQRILPDCTTASLPTPSLSHSGSEISLDSFQPRTPPHVNPELPGQIADSQDADSSTSLNEQKPHNIFTCSPRVDSRPGFSRRPSYDLFECIEQSTQKRLTEPQARYVFSQVVDAVHYLDTLGIAHRDIKDENLIISDDLQIKLIDFGSATVVNPNEPRPFYNLFYGTAAYASSEILLKRSYQAAPAEVWTLGVLLSYLLMGISPFPSPRDTVDGRIFLSETQGPLPSDEAMDLMRKCLDPKPQTRASIAEVKAHPWLKLRS